jgi:catechol 2,3-dioxygenase-like lactoylglutathione lyase family enzyme
MNANEKIKGLSHITLICQDLDKSAHMLKIIFSATEIYSSGDKTLSISREKFFNISGIWLVLMEGMPVDKTYNHIAFEVNNEDLPIFQEVIPSLDLMILPGRKRTPEEGNSIYFYDYDNHLFELHAGNLDTRLHFYNSK